MSAVKGELYLTSNIHRIFKIYAYRTILTFIVALAPAGSRRQSDNCGKSRRFMLVKNNCFCKGSNLLFMGKFFFAQ
jgi:hypothetical protein